MLGATMRGPKSIFFRHPRFRPRRTPCGIDGPGIAPHRPPTPRSAPVGAPNGHRGRVGLVADRPRHARTARPTRPNHMRIRARPGHRYLSLGTPTREPHSSARGDSWNVDTPRTHGVACPAREVISLEFYRK